MDSKKTDAKKGGFSGQLQEKPLEGLLFTMHLQKSSAELILKKDAVTRTIFFRDGGPFFATSSLTSESFVTHLIRSSMVTAAQAEDLKRKSQPGDAYLDLLKATPPLNNFDSIVANFTRQMVVNSFLWHSGEFQLAPLPQAFAKLEVSKLDPLVLISQGIRTHYEMDYLAPKFAKIQDRKLLCTPEFKTLYPQLAFTPAEQDLLKRIDSQATVGALTVSPGLDLLSALRLIWTLFSLRMVGMVQTAESKKASEVPKPEEKKPVASPPKPEEKEVPLDPKALRIEIEERFLAFEKQTYFELLNVSRKDLPPKIKKSYLDLAKRYHPDALINLGLGELTKKAGSIFARMTDAHDTLTNPERRKEYEASIDMDPSVVAKINDIVRAETEFQKGEIMLRNRSYPAALKQFELALALNPEEAEHYVYVGWAKFLNSTADRATAAAEARKVIQRGIAMRANVDMAYIFLGRMAKITNDIPEAEKLFRKALQVNPNNDQAASEISALHKKK